MQLSRYLAIPCPVEVESSPTSLVQGYGKDWPRSSLQDRRNLLSHVVFGPLLLPGAKVLKGGAARREVTRPAGNLKGESRDSIIIVCTEYNAR